MTIRYRPFALISLVAITLAVIAVSATVYGLSNTSEVVDVTPLGVGLEAAIDAELTEDETGGDWYSFSAVAGQNYIVELKSTIATTRHANDSSGDHPSFVTGHLIDPSILKILDIDQTQVMGEQDRGGIVPNSSRAFFTPETDGTHYIVVGAGVLDRTATGFYTISIRADDHADDYRTATNITVRPGYSLTATIDSDVAHDDPRLKPWDWISSLRVGNDNPRPHQGVESLDDRDVFRVEFPEMGWYQLQISDAPTGVGIWHIWRDDGSLHTYTTASPVVSLTDHFFRGTLYVEVGTPYESEGNTGAFTLSLIPIELDP